MRTRLILLPVILACLTITQFAFADTCTARQPQTISIVSTNDLHGALTGGVQSWSHNDAVGGVDWIAGYFDIVEEENPGGVVYLDAGDAFQGTLISNQFFGESTVDALNAMGLEAMAIGNHEFDWGLDALENLRHIADFSFLAANIFTTNSSCWCESHCHRNRPSWAKPYRMIQRKGVKLGIIGLANPATPSLTNPTVVENLAFTDPVAAVEKYTPILRRRGADAIIVLAHIGGSWPDFDDGLGELACGLDATTVDLIISGHSHSRIDDYICNIPVVQSYSSGTAFSRVDMTVDPVKNRVTALEMNSSPVTTYQTYYGNPAAYQRWDTGEWQDVVPDATVTSIVAEYATEVEALQHLVIGETAAPITRNYREESSMGDLVTDIMREATPEIDFALTNSGGLRANIDAGDIEYGDVYEALPFDNTLVLVSLSGDEVIAALEEGITGDHGVVQVSGLAFTFDYDAAPGDRIDGDVIDLNTNTPIVGDAIYTVAVNDFMASGGDDYSVLALAPQTDTYIPVRDLVVWWIQENSPFAPPRPAIEQRIITRGTAPE
jgi:5'-nucleotidase / UDP-sugar diphosphatase